MLIPYQCIKRCGQVLIAARGSSIDTFNSESGSLLSTWRVPSAEEPNPVSSSSKAIVESLESYDLESTEGVGDAYAPATKRRKLSTVEDIAQEPAQTNGAKGQEKGSKRDNKRSDVVISNLETPVVILLEVTRDERHVTAVTGEDKAIRVFKLGDDGLIQLSCRSMPKRPCAIAITLDGSTIISADKFGDVYSLPLLVPTTIGRSSEVESPAADPIFAQPFVPAANTLTVHSQRNRKALENQKRQNNRPLEKLEPKCKHKLLLGHVSMLTDLALVNLKGRNYILTADRDEHIRVSRGIPQAHIIEGFCQGHREFISRLLIPDNRLEILISGGGDDELCVWDWAKGILVSRADLKLHVEDIMGGLGGDDIDDESSGASKIAVSRIMHVGLLKNDMVDDLVVVACEGIPAIFVFLLTIQHQLQHIQSLKVSGNVLDIASGARNGLVLSIDTIHKLGSRTEQRGPTTESIRPLWHFMFQGWGLVPSTIEFETVIDEVRDIGRSTDLLYGLENLRKRDGDAKQED